MIKALDMPLVVGLIINRNGSPESGICYTLSTTSAALSLSENRHVGKRFGGNDADGDFPTMEIGATTGFFCKSPAHRPSVC